MRLIPFFSAILVLFLLVFASPAFADAPDWFDPDSIDPFAENAGDFLDLDVSELKDAAWGYYTDGDYTTAAQYYLALLSYNITDGSSIYNLACCYGLLGDADRAAEFVQRAFNAGYTDVDWISWDPDFESVRETPVFQTTLIQLSLQVEAERAELGGLIYLDAQGFFECRVMLPDDYDPARQYPMIVGLHGYGSNIDRFIGLYDRFENHDFIYATPRAPFPFFNGSDLGYSWNEGDQNDPDFWMRSTENAIEYVAGAVEQLKDRYNVGEVYLLGFSQGCSLAYMAGIKHHDLFDGLICFGGWLDNEYLDESTIKSANDTRIFIGHASDDRVVDFESAIAARDLLTEYGFDVTFFEFEGGHTVPEPGVHWVEQWIKGLAPNYVYF